MRPEAPAVSRGLAASTLAQSPCMSDAISATVSALTRGLPAGAQFSQTRPPSWAMKNLMRAGRPAAGALGEPGRPARQRHGAEHVGVQDAARGMLAARERAQPADEQQVLLRRRLGLVQAVGGLDHRAGGGVPVVVRGDVGPVRAERLGLLHDVEGAPDVELHVGDHERLQPRAEAGGRAPDALGDRAHLAVPLAEHRDDPVGLTQLVGAQHHDFVSISGHPSIIPGRHHNGR